MRPQRWVIVPRVHETVLATETDFIHFHIHLPNFSMLVERIIMKRLSDSFIHNSAIGKCQQQLCFSSRPKTVKLSCCSSVCYFSDQLILKLTGDVQEWIVLWTSESKTVILI